jgi:hypothetical protein
MASPLVRHADRADRSKSYERYKTDMRNVWHEHTDYTKDYIVAAIENLGSATTISKRLIANQHDIARVVEAMLDMHEKNSENPSKVMRLVQKALEEHIVIAVRIVERLSQLESNRSVSRERVRALFRTVTSLLSGADGSTLFEVTHDELRTAAKSPTEDKENILYHIWRWYVNAESITTLIDGLDEARAYERRHGGVKVFKLVRMAMFQHLKETILEALAYYVKDYETWIENYDRATAHMQDVADVLSDILMLR